MEVLSKLIKKLEKTNSRYQILDSLYKYEELKKEFYDLTGNDDLPKDV